MKITSIHLYSIQFRKEHQLNMTIKSTVSIQYFGDYLLLLDQKNYPHIHFLTIKQLEDVWNAIHSLQILNTSTIGMAAAFGLAVWANQQNHGQLDRFQQELQKQHDYLASARPLSINLTRTLNRILSAASSAHTVSEAVDLIEIEALSIQREYEVICHKIGEYALCLFQSGDRILTICNEGGITSSRYSTALAPFYLAQDLGIPLSIFACEAHPFSKESELSTKELQESGMDITLITNNMAAHTMRTQNISAVIVGCEYISANGDIANRTGTFGLALQAKALGIPFYVATPRSTINLSILTGDQFSTEGLDEYGYTDFPGTSRTSIRKKTSNPIFDITPHDYITAIITEAGIIYGNYKENLSKIINKPTYVFTHSDKVHYK